MADVILTRFLYGQEATFGTMHYGELPICCTLELPWKQNKSRISCIPTGLYKTVVYQSPTKGKVWLLKDVPGRSMIEIHIGNFPKDILGCIAVGDSFFRDRPGVLNSKKTFDFMWSVLPKEFNLIIRDFQSSSVGPQPVHNKPQLNGASAIPQL